MRITFDHVNGFGKITHQDFIYSNPEGYLENNETEDNVLNHGWIPWKNKWYNCRSVRINLKKYFPNKTTKKDYKKINYSFENIHEFKNYEKSEEIYKAYCENNNFNRSIPIKDIIDNSNYFFTFKYKNEIKGYTFCILYKESLVSLEFIHNFTCQNISLGFISQHYECEVARSLDKKYVYLLGGYESSCIYKSRFHGMEWWTGKEWSEDMNLYIRLCKRDETINIINYNDNI